MYFGKGSQEEIINYLGQTLLTITGIKFVEYQRVYDSGLTVNRCPGCYVNSVRIDKTKILKDIVRNIFTVGIVGFVWAKGTEKLSTVLHAFTEQMKDKIVVDSTCGNKAYDSRVLIIENDAGSRYPQGMVVIMSEIIFFSSE